MAAPENLITRQTRNPSPEPGDGICPTVTQHSATATAGQEAWASLLSEAKGSIGNFCIADNFLELLELIPELNAQESKPFVIHDEPDLPDALPLLKYALEWITTADSACERPTKRTYHYLTLGALQPVACEYLDAGEEHAFSWPGIQVGQMKHLSRLILSWSFILSSRWVEILCAAGEKASMRQNENSDNFWEMVIGRQWEATVTRGKNTFYAPWCVEKLPAAPGYVLYRTITIATSLPCA